MATKQISRQISMNSDKKNCLHIYHVEKCLHMTDFTSHFSTWHDFSLYLPCGDISPTEHLSCRDTSPHDNLSHGKISPHDRFFLHQHRWWCWWQISGMIVCRNVYHPWVSKAQVMTEKHHKLSRTWKHSNSSVLAMKKITQEWSTLLNFSETDHGC